MDRGRESSEQVLWEGAGGRGKEIKAFCLSCVGIGCGGTAEFQGQGRGIRADQIRGARVWGRAQQVLFALSVQFDARPEAHRAYR